MEHQDMLRRFVLAAMGLDSHDAAVDNHVRNCNTCKQSLPNFSVSLVAAVSRLQNNGHCSTIAYSHNPAKGESGADVADPSMLHPPDWHKIT